MALDLDPRTALVAAAGAAVIGSPEARRTIGRGAGWLAAAAWRIASPVVRPVFDAGRDMAGEARHAAAGNGAAAMADEPGTPAARAGRTRRVSPTEA
jgi:hypothetical protein